jgi:methionyl-tRNA formyltransferase
MRVVLLAMTGMGNAALRAMLDADIDVVAVITDHDRGPGFPYYPCRDLLSACMHEDIPAWTGVRLRDPDTLNRIRAARADAFVIATSAKIVPDPIIAAFDGRVINCHPSLLPRHRGPTPIPWTIECGDAETGITFIQPNAELDAGPIWHQERIPVQPADTAGTLRCRLDQVILPAALPAVVRGVVDGTLTPAPQTGAATYEPRHREELDDVDWNHQTADDCLRRFRARAPYPGTRVALNGHRCPLLHLARVGDRPLHPAGRLAHNHLGQVLIDVVDGRLLGTLGPPD